MIYEILNYDHLSNIAFYILISLLILKFSNIIFVLLTKPRSFRLKTTFRHLRVSEKPTIKESQVSNCTFKKSLLGLPSEVSFMQKSSIIVSGMSVCLIIFDFLFSNKGILISTEIFYIRTEQL